MFAERELKSSTASKRLEEPVLGEVKVGWKCWYENGQKLSLSAGPP
jgi:hypothetical protein